jgi:hypothetical protein
MSVAADILASYRSPATVIRRHVANGPQEGRAFIFLQLACGLVFISRWPGLSRAAHLDPTTPLDMRLGGALLGWLFIAPLAFYAIAALTHLVARAFGGSGSGFDSRMALFWSLLVVTPIWLLHGLTAGFVGPGPQMSAVGILLLLAFFGVWIPAFIAVHKKPDKSET